MGNMIVIVQEKTKNFIANMKSHSSSWPCNVCGKNFSTSEDTYKKNTKTYKRGAGVLQVIKVAKTIYILGKEV